MVMSLMFTAIEMELSKESMATIAWLAAEILMHCIPAHVCCSMGNLTGNIFVQMY